MKIQQTHYLSLLDCRDCKLVEYVEEKFPRQYFLPGADRVQSHLPNLDSHEY